MRMRATVGILVVLFVSWGNYLSAQVVKPHDKVTRTEEPPIAGSFALDFGIPSMSGVRSMSDSSAARHRGEKSGLLAATLSLALPGAGEYYAGKYWRAGGFLGAEVGLWLVYAIYENRGDDQTAFFQDYADRFWSVVRYAEWMERYGPRLNPEAGSSGGIVISSDPNLPPWDRVDWNKLNAYEMAIGRKSGTYFSHTLPRRPDQQYYELIGKYGQYNPGWIDAEVDETNFHSEHSKRFREYSELRGKANDYYNIAGTAAKLLVLNHVLSALDAAWVVSQHNKSIRLEAHLVPLQRGFGFVEFVPTTILTLSF